MSPVCLCFRVPWTFLCVYNMSLLPAFVCISLWMCIQPQLTQRWRWQTTRCGASRRRHKESTDWGRLVHESLRWSCSGQEGGKDGQGQLGSMCPQIWVHIKRHKEAHSFCSVGVCVFVPGKGCGRLEDSSSVNPVVWGFESIACRLLSLWEVGWPVEMVDIARTGSKTVKRWRFSRKE